MKKTIILLALAAAISCNRQERFQEPEPSALLLEIKDERRLLSTDQLADWIINKDPGLLLIDVRDPKSHLQFTLPGAMSIPIANLLDPAQQDKINCDKYTVVFFSDDDILAEQAWMLNRRKGCTNSYILRGGLNEWTETIMQPKEPPQTASAAAFELYRFRQAACKYFMGGSKMLKAEPFVPQVAEQTPAAPKKTIPLKPKKVEKEEEEGC